MNVQIVGFRFGPQFDLCENLIGERITHDETGMSSGASQIDQSTFSQQDYVSEEKM